MIYHILALILGFLLDLLVGDPYCLPHPVRLIGHLISAFENKTLKDAHTEKKKRAAGRSLVLTVCLASLITVSLLTVAAYFIHPAVGIAVETVLTYYALAAKSLASESMKVYKKLKKNDLDGARSAVSMIVGRDTQNLDEKGVTKAAVETVAENTSDGVIAPLLYLTIGGPVLGFLYKAINTMDSMVGYKNERYADYGRCAAKLDDIVNFIPSRISAILMIVSCVFLGKSYDAAGSYKIYKRDRFNHSSPNSAQTEAACAGALGIKLAGPASYFGKTVDKPYIGDETRDIEPEDIKRAIVLMYASVVLCLLICLVILCMVAIFTGTI